MTREHVSFKTTRSEALTIGRIVERYKQLFIAAGNKPSSFDALSLSMDLSACIAQGCPLKLDELLAADDFNFVHDVGGISRHIDRTTGKLTDCFLPRFART